MNESLRPAPRESVDLSEEKQELLKLEAEERFVFHGTAADVDALEPRQAVDNVRGPDGNPAVFASSKADYAIFMAIFNKENCPTGTKTTSGFTIDDAGTIEMKFSASKSTLETLRPAAAGWVYVFDKSNFAVRQPGSVEFVSEKQVHPLRRIRVTKRDLPENIQATD